MWDSRSTVRGKRETGDMTDKTLFIWGRRNLSIINCMYAYHFILQFHLMIILNLLIMTFMTFKPALTTCWMDGYLLFVGSKRGVLGTRRWRSPQRQRTLAFSTCLHIVGGLQRRRCVVTAWLLLEMMMAAQQRLLFDWSTSQADPTPNKGSTKKWGL